MERIAHSHKFNVIFSGIRFVFVPVMWQDVQIRIQSILSLAEDMQRIGRFNGCGRKETSRCQLAQTTHRRGSLLLAFFLCQILLMDPLLFLARSLPKRPNWASSSGAVQGVPTLAVHYRRCRSQGLKCRLHDGARPVNNAGWW